MENGAPVEIAAGGPTVRLLDARTDGLDEACLRELARRTATATAARHVSRSYRYPYALVAWHSKRVGADIERVEPLEKSFLESILTPAERPHLRHLEPAAISSLWCSKEALSKALGDALSYDPQRLDSPVLWPDGRSGPWRARGLEAPEGYVAWVCWRSS